MFQGQIINDQNNSKGSSQERTETHHPESLFYFNYYFCHNGSLLRKQVILMILNFRNFK